MPVVQNSVEKGHIFRFEDLLCTYYFVGGMSEAVSLFAKFRFCASSPESRDILSAYRRDFAKHADNVVRSAVGWCLNLYRAILQKKNKVCIQVFKKGFFVDTSSTTPQFLQDTRSYKCRALLAFRISRVVDDKVPLHAAHFLLRS